MKRKRNGLRNEKGNKRREKGDERSKCEKWKREN